MDLKKYIYGHCVKPVKVSVFDAYSQSYVLRELPCGKCIHCQNTHVNEWITRLVAQRKYSKYCYFVSLDYAPFDTNNDNSMLLATETCACFNDINSTKTFGLQPLVLCKNHLQDFFKRLRKNTNVKIQYFSCGEYGMHADGHGFGRPHFHNLIFTNDPISEDSFNDAWTVNGYKIGRVDFVDMSGFDLGDPNLLKSFKYVAKYLQKTDFDFNKLATIDFHRINFEIINQVFDDPNSLFRQFIPDCQLSKNSIDERWKEYTTRFAPFIVCSRRPAIGSAYLAENLERFKEQDFRLFGLPKDLSTFPRYYVRKTKEDLYSYRCIGRVSEKPSSISRLGTITTLLSELYDSRLSLENWSETAQFTWSCYNDKKNGRHYFRIKEWSNPIECRLLNFYDDKNKFMYQFNGYSYNVWAKLKNATYILLETMDIYDVLCQIQPSWDHYRKTWLSTDYLRRVLNEKDLDNSILSMYPGKDRDDCYSMFKEDIKNINRIEIETRYKRKLLQQNSKLTL